MKKNKPIASNISEVIKQRRDRLNIKMGYLDLILRILAFAFIGWLLFTQILLVTQAKGQGMFPFVKDGDLVIGFRQQKYYVQDDIVVYRLEGKQYIGRIAAREMDTVMLDESGTVLVNGTPQSGEVLYPTYKKGKYKYPMKVPKGRIFVLGDYRTQTKDSRDFGTVSMKQVEGKVITILRRQGL